MKKIVFCLLAIPACIGILFSYRAWIIQPSLLTQGVEVKIIEGWSTAQIALLLETKGVIDFPLGYRIYSYIDSAGRKGRPGVYVLRSGMSYHDIAIRLFSGPLREEVQIRVNEGFNTSDIEKLLKEHGITKMSFEAFPWHDAYPFVEGSSLEGYLFPDTYRVYVDELPNAFLKKQLDEFAKRYPRLQDEAAKQRRTVRDIIILASIVEKEVANPDDRKIVAGIFWNRLQDHMPLQSDATVNYISVGGHTRPTIDELAIDSVYNTYTHAGLPPGPICNPGDDALEAALHPAATPYRFFLTDDAGKLYVAKTFTEHIRNRAKAFGGVRHQTVDMLN